MVECYARGWRRYVLAPLIRPMCFICRTALLLQATSDPTWMTLLRRVSVLLLQSVSVHPSYVVFLLGSFFFFLQNGTRRRSNPALLNVQVLSLMLSQQCPAGFTLVLLHYLLNNGYYRLLGRALSQIVRTTLSNVFSNNPFRSPASIFEINTHLTPSGHAARCSLYIHRHVFRALCILSGGFHYIHPYHSHFAKSPPTQFAHISRTVNPPLEYSHSLRCANINQHLQHPIHSRVSHTSTRQSLCIRASKV